MRSFDQRLEEIHRRSEELKNKQRVRRKTVLTVTPLILCFMLCVGAVLTGIHAYWDGAAGSANGGMPDRGQYPENQPGYSAGTAGTVTGIRIAGKGEDRTVSDPEAIAEICSLLEKVTAPTPNFSISGSPVGGIDQDPGDGYDGNKFYGDPQWNDYYTVSFLGEDGVIRQYRLNKTILTELTTGEMDFLWEDDMTALYGLLGLDAQ